MSCEEKWSNLIIKLEPDHIEVKTGTGLWVRAYIDSDKVYVDKAVVNLPSSRINNRRKISKNDFMLVCSYYDRWVSGNVGIRHEVSRLSRNTAYIFALIAYLN